MSWDTITVDALVASALILAFRKGYASGIVNQIIWLGSFVIAYLVGVTFSYDLAALADFAVYNKSVTIALAFVLLFSLTILLLHFVGRRLTSILNLSVIGILNSILGGLLNVLVLAATLAAVTALTTILAPDTERYLDRTMTIGQITTVEKWVRDERIVDRTRHEIKELRDKVN